VTSAEEFEMVVLYPVMVAVAGGALQADGSWVIQSDSVAPGPLPLKLGDHELGQWVCAFAEMWTRDGSTEARIRMRRIPD
jgi:hypothetical protein